MSILKGITWNHSRGYTPLIATSQRFSEINPEINIFWEKRSLKEFADYSLEKLTETYDLLIIDHPWVGKASAEKIILPLDEYLPKAYLDAQLNQSVGLSYMSYNYDNHQWALPIDAATPVAIYRPDLFAKAQKEIPKSWSELLELAKDGKVITPSIPIDLLMNFYSFCLIVGEEPFTVDDCVISREKGIEAMEMMEELWSLLDVKAFDLNPINIAEIMSRSEKYWYCPFAYGYSNYSRRGYSQSLLKYTNIISAQNGNLFRSTLGGTGIAISSNSKNKEDAMEYLRWVCSGEIQQSIYVENGGQPAHRQAWLDKGSNILTQNFFADTLETLDNAYVRPRYNGYLDFQDSAGNYVREFLMGYVDKEKALQEINRIYKKSLMN